MRPSQKLNDIEQEHLQELYDAAGVARDELPYTEQFEKLCHDFQDRTFKNAEPEQIFGALVRYVRSSTCGAGQVDAVQLEPEQVSRLRDVLRRHSNGGRLLPYSSEFEAAQKEFSSLTKTNLSSRDFWLAICQAQGRSRRPPQRSRAKAAPEPSEDEE